jgi:hypothetical protein
LDHCVIEPGGTVEGGRRAGRCQRLNGKMNPISPRWDELLTEPPRLSMLTYLHNVFTIPL